MILRTTYTGNGQSLLEDKRFYPSQSWAQNWRADVSVVLDDAGVQQERVIYSPYGQPFAMPAGDTNFDGDFEAGVDGDELADWDINGVPYRAYADVNLDGDVDGADAAAASEHDLGWNVLTSGGGGASGVNNRLGYAGYIHDRDVATAAHVRHRVYKIDLDRELSTRMGGSQVDATAPGASFTVATPGCSATDRAAGICALNCSAQTPPAGGCTVNPQQTACTQYAGGACVFRCTATGVWGTGASCTSGTCNPAGTACAP